jgi:CheY-like chemotaxis protein
MNSESSNNNINLATNNWKGKNILVVDDIEANYLVLQLYFKKYKINHFWAVNGNDAVEFCRANPHLDLVFMDIKMPVMDGLEATIKIKELTHNKLAVIAYTAYVDGEDRQECKAAGCDDFISKPIDFYDLMEVLLKYLK